MICWLIWNRRWRRCKRYAANALKKINLSTPGVPHQIIECRHAKFPQANIIRPATFWGTLYIFSYGMSGDGINLAHGQDQKLIGKQLNLLQDVNGKYIIKEFFNVANSPAGQGWIDYDWPNNVTNSVDAKSSYIERIGDILVGCGLYI